jgi:hypothetical protein
MSLTDNPPSRDSLRDERIDRRIAEDVAAGESQRADQQRERANLYARAAAVESVQAANARSDRDAAVMTSEIATSEARSATFGYWMLLGLVAIALVIGAIWYANRPAESVATTTVNNRELPAPAAPQASPYTVQQTPAASVPIAATNGVATQSADTAPVSAVPSPGEAPPAAAYTAGIPYSSNAAAPASPSDQSTPLAGYRDSNAAGNGGTSGSVQSGAATDNGSANSGQ